MAEVETQFPGTLPATRSSKSQPVQGLWELNTAPGEEGKETNRERAQGTS